MRRLLKNLVTVLTLTLSGYSYAQCGAPAPMLCDLDGDRTVDQSDIDALLLLKGTAVSQGDLRDIDGDGVITVLDARKCVSYCKNENCVADKAPIAVASSNSNIAGSFAKVILDGSLSNDPDGTIKSYAWEQLSGPPLEIQSASNSIAQFITPWVATREMASIKLTVVDDQNLASSAEVNIDIVPTDNSELDVSFLSFEYLKPTGSDEGHADYFHIEGPPTANDNVVVEAVLYGMINEVTFEFRNVNGEVIAQAPLSLVSGSANPPFRYGGNVTIPSEPFVVVAIGTTFDGQSFEVSLDSVIIPTVGGAP